MFGSGPMFFSSDEDDEVFQMSDNESLPREDHHAEYE